MILCLKRKLVIVSLEPLRQSSKLLHIHLRPFLRSALGLLRYLEVQLVENPDFVYPAAATNANSARRDCTGCHRTSSSSSQFHCDLLPWEMILGSVETNTLNCVRSILMIRLKININRN